MDDPVREIPRIIETLCKAPPGAQRAAIETYFTPTASFTHPFCRTGSFAGSIWLIIMIYRWYKILSPRIDVEIESVAFDKDNLRLYVSVQQNFKIWMVPFYNASVKLVTVLQLTTDPIPPGPDLEELESELLQNQPSPPHSFETEDVNNGWKKVTGSAKNGKNKKERRANPQHNSHSFKEAVTDDEQDKFYIQSQNDLYQTSEFIKFVVPWGIGVLLVVLWQFWATFFCVLGTKIYDLLMWLPHKVFGGHHEVFDNHDKESLGPD